MTGTRSITRYVRILAGIGGFALGAAGYAGMRLAADTSPGFHGTTYPDAPAAPGFELVDHLGAPAVLDRWEGTPLLLFFGFTNCPDVCPLTLEALTRVLRDQEVGPEEAQVLLITVDPENDTPARMAEYVGRYAPYVTGLTGDSQTLERVQADYGVYAEPATGHGGHVSIAHTPLVFGIDRDGRLRVLIHPEEGDEVLGDDIRTLLRIPGEQGG